FKSELEKSMAPDRLTGSLNVSGLGYSDTELSGSLPGVHTTIPGKARASAPPPSVSETRASSAEYLVSEIRRHKTGVGLIALSVIIAAVALIYFFYPRSRTTLTDKDTILLADFVNTTGDSVFDDTLRQALSAQLSQSPFLDIFSEDRVRETLRFMERAP